LVRKNPPDFSLFIPSTNMVKTHTILLALTAALSTANPVDVPYDQAFEEGLNLLQLRAASTPAKIASNSTVKTHESPRQRERQECPHEIEEQVANQGDTVFGCSGDLRAVSTVQCSMWGEPHITATWPSPRAVVQRARFGIDVFYIPGLYRMASAADGSWEVQMFSCGVYACAMAARLGKDIIEVIVNAQGNLEYFVNGKLTSAGQTEGKISLDSTHRHIVADHFDQNRRPVDQPGSCNDDPNGQIMLDFVQSKPIGSYHRGNNRYNLNVHLVAQSDAVTSKDSDGNAICNEVTGGAWRWSRWDSQPIAVGESLFISTGTRACEGCNSVLGWGTHPNGGGQAAANRAQQQCGGLVENLDDLRLDRVCASQNIAIDDAANACRGLADTPDFFADCQLDYCFSGGNVQAAAEAQDEEAVENPQPICAGAAGDACDPASSCCNALRDQATLQLDNVVTSNLCGTEGGEQELRFGRALTQNGVNMDLVVTAVGEIECDSKLTNAKFGSKSAEIGLLAVKAGTEATFKFEFVKSGTAELVAPQSLMLSMLDLDQGKKGKQRESVQVCGGGGAIVTDDSELEVVGAGDCTTVTSTTHGTGKDNPESVEGMSQMQRARTAAFPVTGSSFTAKMGVSKKGHNPRRFMFAGHPSVSCVLK
jgi:hypothetical protein